MTRLMTAAVMALALSVAISAQEPARQSGVRAAVPPPAQVNLNTATATQLESLPGVGAKTAELILEYRQKNGGFKKVEDLMNVRGVGEKSFLKLKSLVVVTPAKTERPGQ